VVFHTEDKRALEMFSVYVYKDKINVDIGEVNDGAE